ncbi:flagellar hook capping protein [candidate division KSB1 bacterium]|nr:MAG: flagellar hook capping protein [candidate division KSB1 bacterium]
MVNPVGGASSGQSNSNLFTSFVDNPDAALGKTDFLQLLITKLRYQDPLKPMTDESFIADLAQFSSLEQMQNLNTAILNQSSSIDGLNTNLIALIMMQNTTQAASLIGKTVVVEVQDAEGNPVNIEGTVDIVRFVDGQPKIVINGVEYELSSVREIKA